MEAVLQNVVTELCFCNNFPIFAIEIDKDMETTLIRIGNSRGIIIPARILKKMKIGEGDKVILEENGEKGFSLRFVHKEVPRTGVFIGVFKELEKYYDPDNDPWNNEDPVEYVRKLRDESGVEKRILPDW